MSLKSLIPWLCVLALIAGLAWMYALGQKKDMDIAALRQDSEQLQKLRAEAEEGKGDAKQSDSEELARLRKDNEELLRLRNEARQLRTEKQQLSTQLQTAQAQVQGIQSQMQALRANPAAPGTPGAPNAAADAAFRARYGVQPVTPEQAQTAGCINNLRLIDGAKHQWALEKQKSGSSLMTAADLAPYLKTNALPTCPAGGVYTLNPVSVPPICSIPGHAISR